MLYKYTKYPTKQNKMAKIVDRNAFYCYEEKKHTDVQQGVVIPNAEYLTMKRLIRKEFIRNMKRNELAY
jgi:hypothetical protein